MCSWLYLERKKDAFLLLLKVRPTESTSPPVRWRSLIHTRTYRHLVAVATIATIAPLIFMFEQMHFIPFSTPTDSSAGAVRARSRFFIPKTPGSAGEQCESKHTCEMVWRRIRERGKMRGEREGGWMMPMMIGKKSHDSHFWPAAEMRSSRPLKWTFS